MIFISVDLVDVCNDVAWIYKGDKAYIREIKYDHLFRFFLLRAVSDPLQFLQYHFSGSFFSSRHST